MNLKVHPPPPFLHLMSNNGNIMPWRVLVSFRMQPWILNAPFSFLFSKTKTVIGYKNCTIQLPRTTNRIDVLYIIKSPVLFITTVVLSLVRWTGQQFTYDMVWRNFQIVCMHVNKTDVCVMLWKTYAYVSCDPWRIQEFRNRRMRSRRRMI